ncbi:hypothetical protein [Nocardiopsis ansamitocini]|uniref:Uncharacterized protein n=1 Tax=Nocardiopsis ansamitocini TaxID=1670832 RepID=A0A9W6P7L1_9ACTN|nr:hypothetical protein [Nocardiopsis ansamitocini]GLU48534.1 hypothetical protein Nans01_28850 [Nocardiopsis ansamitocini]
MERSLRGQRPGMENLDASAGGPGADRRPPGADAAAVEAAGRLTEALEIVECARGHLYAMHRLTGEADLKLDEVVTRLRAGGHEELAAGIEHSLVGRNVIEGRWTYQLVEEYDDGYYTHFRDAERTVREALLGGVRHVQESEMKERRRTAGVPGHEAGPPP